jgi:AraC-like DNA-binding protein
MKPMDLVPHQELRERSCEPIAHRAQVLRSTIGRVEILRCGGVRPHSSPEGFSPEFQVCIPYRGLFVWHVAGDTVVADANQVLFVAADEAFRITEPLSTGYAELIITPSLDVLTDIAKVRESGLKHHSWFRRRSRPANPRLQYLTARLLHAAAGVEGLLAAEELTVTVVRTALTVEPRLSMPSEPTGRLIRRAKEFVQAHLATPLRLSHISAAAGASPAYLTNVFRLVEGVPLHRYVMQLRLARALVELPHTQDLTTLALDLGFSSHSHFAAAFRKAYGTTPSEFRERSRRTEQRRIA